MGDQEPGRGIPPIHVQPLSFDNIGDLNEGQVALSFQDALQKIKSDLFDRRRLDKPRKVVVEVTLDPVMDSSGYISDVEILVGIAAKLPPVKLGSRAMLTEKAGELDVVFRNDVPEDPRQGHLNEVGNELRK